MNYFELFHLPVQFELDAEQLKKTYHVLQKTVHPDNYAMSSSYEKKLSVQKTALINDAYRVLLSDILRAEYLLMLKGVVLPDEKETMQDNVFLMLQMEMHEQVNEAEDAQQILELLSQIGSHQQDLLLALSRELKGDTLISCFALINKLKFFNKLERTLKDKL